MATAAVLDPAMNSVLGSVLVGSGVALVFICHQESSLSPNPEDKVCIK